MCHLEKTYILCDFENHFIFIVFKETAIFSNVNQVILSSKFKIHTVEISATSLCLLLKRTCLIIWNTTRNGDNTLYRLTSCRQPHVYISVITILSRCTTTRACLDSIRSIYLYPFEAIDLLPLY